MKRLFTTTLLLCATTLIFAQALQKRTLEAFRGSGKMKIDGQLDEAAWINAPVAKDFLFRWPTPGKPATEQTEIKVIYDDYAMYVGAYMHDSKPDSLLKNLTQRDNNNNTDWFFVTLDTYMDGQNGSGFGVTAANVQFDCKYAIANADQDEGNQDGEDFNWNAVWKSSVKIMPDGWVAELEIPYSALRFPKKDLQNWHINFFRRIFRKGETDSWNEIKATESGSLRQSGILQGISNIKMPLRLQATPFVSVYGADFYDKNASPRNALSSSFNAGMDVKYGINEAFTLDATIIPDFGQVRSDNQVVNLSPFEVRFDDFRPFFTEGTELFNKGGLFYSRRIGGRSHNFDNVSNKITSTEEIVDNPSKAQLYNSTKISGRTAKGTGIGVLNAVQAPTFATLKDTETNKERKVESSPLTNYNVMVFDQNLKNNSSIAIVNTNVWRAGSTYDANVTNLNWNLKNKKNSYSLSGNFALSQQMFDTTKFGHKMNVDLNKISGKWNWGLNYSETSAQYDQSDLGYQQGYNWRNYNAWWSYNQYEPKGRWNNFWINQWNWYGTLQGRNAFTEGGIGYNMGGNTKNFHNMGLNINIFPAGENDYFEPRTYDFVSYFHVPKIGNANFWYNSDSRKKWRFRLGTWARILKGNARFDAENWGGVNYQFNKKFTMSYRFNTTIGGNNIGYTWRQDAAVDNNTLKDEDILFGRRKIIGYDNTLGAVLTFNNKANLSLRVRHYWQQVRYKDFYLLKDKGQIEKIAYNGLDAEGKNAHDINANYFNIDCVFTWRFAPGSDLFITWKNAIDNENQEFLRYNYLGNASRLFSFPQDNSLNIKVLYFLDYAETKRKLSRE